MINNKEVRDLTDGSRLTKEQVLFLDLYEDNLDVNASARDSGLDVSNIRRALRGNTEFSKMFRRLSDNIERDPRFGRLGSLSMLIELKDRAREEAKYDLEFKIIQEINKMIDGNLAATKKVVENVDIKVNGIIDLTVPPKEPKTLDIRHEEL
jgi:hypothetical protein